MPRLTVAVPLTALTLSGKENGPRWRLREQLALISQT